MGASVMGYGGSCCVKKQGGMNCGQRFCVALDSRHVAGHPWLGVGWQLTTAASSPPLLAEETSLPVGTFFELVGTWGMSLTEIFVPVVNTPALLICL